MSRIRSPLTAKLVAKMIKIAGANRIITLNLHSDDITRFSSIPIMNLNSQNDILNILKNELVDQKNCVIITPDAGSRKRFVDLGAKNIFSEALIHKGRQRIAFVSISYIF